MPPWKREGTGDDRLLALALSHKSGLHRYAHRNQESIQLGERAIALARAAGDPAVLSEALTNLGAAKWQLGDPEGRTVIQEGVRVAVSAGRAQEACYAYLAVVDNLLRDLSPGHVERYVVAAFDHAERAEHLAYLSQTFAKRGRSAWPSGPGTRPRRTPSS